MSRIYLPSERNYSWKYLQDYLQGKYVNVQSYSNVKRVVENSCIAWTEI